MKRCIVIVAFVLMATGCANYQAARNFSREQVAVQEKQVEALQKQFAAIEAFADASLAVTQWRLDEITGRIQELYARKARIALNKTDLTDEQKDAILKDMATSISSEAATNEISKRRITELVGMLKAKDAEILAAQAEILAASKQLDEWVQLKKVDEVLLLRLGDRLKGAQDKLINAVEGAGSIFDQIRQLLPKPPTPPTPVVSRNRRQRQRGMSHGPTNV
jgi:hypothetical protein